MAWRGAVGSVLSKAIMAAGSCGDQALKCRYGRKPSFVLPNGGTPSGNLSMEEVVLVDFRKKGLWPSDYYCCS